MTGPAASTGRQGGRGGGGSLRHTDKIDCSPANRQRSPPSVTRQPPSVTPIGYPPTAVGYPRRLPNRHRLPPSVTRQPPSLTPVGYPPTAIGYPRRLPSNRRRLPPSVTRQPPSVTPIGYPPTAIGYPRRLPSNRHRLPPSVTRQPPSVTPVGYQTAIGYPRRLPANRRRLTPQLPSVARPPPSVTSGQGAIHNPCPRGEKRPSPDPSGQPWRPQPRGAGSRDPRTALSATNDAAVSGGTTIASAATTAPHDTHHLWTPVNPLRDSCPDTPSLPPFAVVGLVGTLCPALAPKQTGKWHKGPLPSSGEGGGEGLAQGLGI